MADMKTVIGVFTDHNDAAEAVYELQRAHYDPRDISLFMRNKDKKKEMEKTGVDINEGAMSGASTGAIIGGLTGMLVGIGILSLPGGIFLVGGPMAIALGLTGTAATTTAGAVTGALAGGLIGALMELGIPRKDASHYERRISEGGILLAVPVARAGEREVEAIMSVHHASDIKTLVLAEDIRQHQQLMRGTQRTLH